MFATGGTVGLADWIIDVLLFFLFPKDTMTFFFKGLKAFSFKQRRLQLSFIKHITSSRRVDMNKRTVMKH